MGWKLYQLWAQINLSFSKLWMSGIVPQQWGKGPRHRPRDWSSFLGGKAGSVSLTLRDSNVHIKANLLAGLARTKCNQRCSKKASSADNLFEMFYLSLIVSLQPPICAPALPRIMRIIRRGGREFITESYLQVPYGIQLVLHFVILNTH